MEVSVGSLSRFHTFDLARQLERRGVLKSVYTAYPRWKVDGLPHKKVETFPWLLVPSLTCERLGLSGWHRARNWAVTKTFDEWMKRRISRCDVFHCLSSCGLLTHRRVKARYGTKTVCDRGSSHIKNQDEVLAEEHAKWGIPYRGIDPRVIEKESLEYAECDRIVVPSHYAYDSFLQRGISDDKLRIVPYGVDVDLFRPIAKKDDMFRVIYVGAMSLQKGVPYLLEALATINLPKYELWLIGGMTPEIKAIMARYEGAFRYFGKQPRSELYKYYSQASVFAIASIQEGLALVQAQAMACGLPVIATENTGAADLFDHGVEGYIVPIRDPAAIRERVLELYNDREKCSEMGRAAIKRVTGMGGWHRYAERICGVYEELMSRDESQ